MIHFHVDCMSQLKADTAFPEHTTQLDSEWTDMAGEAGASERLHTHYKGIITQHSILVTHPVLTQQPNVMGLLSKLKLPGACLHGVMDFFK